MFKIDDMIVYGGEGVCRVTAIGQLDISGPGNDRMYYTLEPIYRDGIIYAPVDVIVRMRAVIGREKAEELVRQIPDMKAETFADRDARRLTDHYKEIMQSYASEDLVKLIKEIYAKNKSEGRKPSQLDERYMKRAEEILHGELAVALGIPKDDVRQYIADCAHKPEAEAPVLQREVS